eukprot:m.301812 g.301812  ORF g.301812 m.301812 type:complete len:451 (-) comp14934_c0_seq1:136-1488(-)
MLRAMPALVRAPFGPPTRSGSPFVFCRAALRQCTAFRTRGGSRREPAPRPETWSGRFPDPRQGGLSTNNPPAIMTAPQGASRPSAAARLPASAAPGTAPGTNLKQQEEQQPMSTSVSATGPLKSSSPVKAPPTESHHRPSTQHSDRPSRYSPEDWRADQHHHGERERARSRSRSPLRRPRSRSRSPQARVHRRDDRDFAPSCGRADELYHHRDHDYRRERDAPSYEGRDHDRRRPRENDHGEPLRRHPEQLPHSSSGRQDFRAPYSDRPYATSSSRPSSGGYGAPPRRTGYGSTPSAAKPPLSSRLQYPRERTHPDASRSGTSHDAQTSRRGKDLRGAFPTHFAGVTDPSLEAELRDSVRTEWHHIDAIERDDQGVVVNIVWCAQYLNPNSGRANGGKNELHHKCRRCKRIAVHLLGKPMTRDRYCLECDGRTGVPAWFFHRRCPHCAPY